MILGLLKLIFYGAIIFIIFQTFRFIQAIGKGSRRPPSQMRQSNLMVKDEMCNTYLPKEDAIREISEGKEYFFCSAECRKKFLEAKKSK